MFLKILVSLFSILVLTKNISYSIYEYKVNQNIVAAVSVSAISIITIIILNIVLFLIRF